MSGRPSADTVSMRSLAYTAYPDALVQRDQINYFKHLSKSVVSTSFRGLELHTIYTLVRGTI
jgi:hypothetical protein